MDEKIILAIVGPIVAFILSAIFTLWRERGITRINKDEKYFSELDSLIDSVLCFLSKISYSQGHSDDVIEAKMEKDRLEAELTRLIAIKTKSNSIKIPLDKVKIDFRIFDKEIFGRKPLELDSFIADCQAVKKEISHLRYK
jgi:hypothetical protein